MDSNIVENFNETKLKRCLVNFEKKYTDNQKLRIKYAEDPNKFAISETELFAALDELQGVTTQPELYHILISKKTLETLLSLLAHENTDISAKVIATLQELTDLDDRDGQSSFDPLIEALLDANIIDLIVSNLARLNYKLKDEAQAINNSLDIIDNLIDFDSNVATIGSEPLIKWMITQLKGNVEFNSIKLSVGELLSVLLMNSNENKLHLGEIGGIDVLLQQVAYYRRVAPTTGEEHEFLEQTVNCLCIATSNCDYNRESFLNEEGVDLVELILREKREAVKKSNIKLSTLKLFNHVLTSDKNQDSIVSKCCERFVTVLGLRVLFPFFNNPKLVLNERVKKKEYHRFLDEVEEHTSAVLLAMLKHCQNTEHTQRILVKLAESGFDKFNRALDLHDKYFRIVQNQDNTEEESRSIERSSSHFTLRAIDYIILLVCYLGTHFETYDPTSGETLSSYIKKVSSMRSQFKHQLIMGTRRHMEEVSDSAEERESLTLLLKHFEKISKSNPK